MEDTIITFGLASYRDNALLIHQPCFFFFNLSHYGKKIDHTSLVYSFWGLVCSGIDEKKLNQQCKYLAWAEHEAIILSSVNIYIFPPGMDPQLVSDVETKECLPVFSDEQMSDGEWCGWCHPLTGLHLKFVDITSQREIGKRVSSASWKDILQFPFPARRVIHNSFHF